MKSWASVVSGKESTVSSQLETYPPLVDEPNTPTTSEQNRQRPSRKRSSQNYPKISSQAKKQSLPKSKPSAASTAHDNIFVEKLENEKRKYMQKFKQEKDQLCFQVVNGDLFTVDPDVSLAHCVSEDFKMGKGIAKEFKKRFGSVDQLIGQRVKTGGCAFIKLDSRYIFYLVTKKLFYFKPSYSSVEKSLKELSNLCLRLNVTKLAMPMIGSGLDQLEWDIVSRIIDNVFYKSEISISIYKYDFKNELNKNQE
ncbi:O-acetyl-ADP-ribose deacetylase 1 [Brachionus plicatilis]|uniref:O-acetyl-ADP-ribose deacetylase 1 n=1 Tax=Brachionus plicatilis TaxID=10195 RepID=A0A3M7QMJ5_BRAPC|nr:O-acetyl-ADP-ribose deacetylase 1 [Brachionus plicatilis]